MSDYQPKVGDKVMVGEHGPYEVRVVDELHEAAALLLRDDIDPVLVTVGTALWSWLTPAPEPGPDEPTGPGALVRDGGGVLWARDATELKPWVNLEGYSDSAWADIPRPITVILADPAEVETLRGQRDDLFAQRDELQRRIDKVVEYCDDPGNWGTYEKRRWLIAGWLGKGES